MHSRTLSNDEDSFQSFKMIAADMHKAGEPVPEKANEAKRIVPSGDDTSVEHEETNPFEKKSDGSNSIIYYLNT